MVELSLELKQPLSVIRAMSSTDFMYYMTFSAARKERQRVIKEAQEVSATDDMFDKALARHQRKKEGIRSDGD